MTRKEASIEAKEVLDEATAYEDAVCYVTGDDREWLELAIKALEQEPVLDKIRAEIEAEPYVSKMEVLDILDKYNEKGDKGK